MDYAQTITGAVTGFVYPDDGGELTVPLGKIELVRVDMYDAGSARNMYEVLDSHSGDLESLWEIIERVFFDDDYDDIPARSVVIPDRLKLVPEARGHGLGLHVRTAAGRLRSPRATVRA